MDLEKSPQDKDLLNVIFRGFHTIKGGAGFLNAHELVTLCHLTENLFDKLRNSELHLDPVLLDVILAATGEVRLMFNDLGKSVQPQSAPVEMIAALEAALQGKKIKATSLSPAKTGPSVAAVSVARRVSDQSEPDWNMLYSALLGKTSLAVSEPRLTELSQA